MPSGGWRPGAGRPPKPAEAELPPVKGIDDVPPRDYSPLEYLLAIVNDAAQPDWRRDPAAPPMPSCSVTCVARWRFAWQVRPISA